MEKNVYEIIQEWHELLKNEVISEDEFIAKKKELLENDKSTVVIVENEPVINTESFGNNQYDYYQNVYEEESFVSKYLLFIILGTICLGIFGSFYYYDKNKGQTIVVAPISTEGDLTTDKNLTKKTEDKTFTDTETSSLFVTGLTSAKVFTYEQAAEGVEYNYKDGRAFKIGCFYNQVGIMFYSDNENNQREIIDEKFEVGYITDGEQFDYTKTSKFLIGQYDFDVDGIDELIIAIQDNEDTMDHENGITVDVFKLENDKWNLIGILTGVNTLGDPIAEVKMNTLRIDRHLRGFYYEWRLESGKFIDTGDN